MSTKPSLYGPHQIDGPGIKNFVAALNYAAMTGGRNSDGNLQFMVHAAGDDETPHGVSVELVGYFKLALSSFEIARRFADHMDSGLFLFGDQEPIARAFFPGLIVGIRQACVLGEAKARAVAERKGKPRAPSKPEEPISFKGRLDVN